MKQYRLFASYTSSICSLHIYLYIWLCLILSTFCRQLVWAKVSGRKLNTGYFVVQYCFRVSIATLNNMYKAYCIKFSIRMIFNFNAILKYCILVKITNFWYISKQNYFTCSKFNSPLLWHVPLKLYGLCTLHTTRNPAPKSSHLTWNKWNGTDGNWNSTYFICHEHVWKWNYSAS